MTTDKTPATLATAKHGGCVQLGDGLPPLPRMGHIGRVVGDGPHDTRYEPVAYTAEQMREYARSALSAQPSPGSQGEVREQFEAWLDTLRLDRSRHGDGYVWNDVELAWRAVEKFAARQPVGEPVAKSVGIDALVQLLVDDAEECAKGWVERGDAYASGKSAGLLAAADYFRKIATSQRWSEFLSSPAQAVDLGPVRVLADHASGRINHANNGLCPDEVEGHDTRDPDCPVCCALLDSQAVDLGQMPEGWRLSKKATCYQLSHGNEIIGNLVGPDAEENAAIIARVLDSQAVGK